jgi:eukaryotic-like serine/threonine-protein kinase
MPVLQQQNVFAGRYLLDQLLGEGGFSEVWKARDLMANEAVLALKIYAPEQGLDEWGLRQFKNEFSLTHSFSHPHLLKVYHFDVAEGFPYLVMTYCPYGSLGQGIRQDGPYSERQLARVMCQIGSALEEIHGQDPPLIHQDIKPDNILLLQPDLFMLADFGISAPMRTTVSRTTATAQALTLAYAPPERFDYQPTASAASDIFSLGVSLYEMCTTSVPWEGAGGQCLLKGARVPALPAGYSRALSAILEGCMAADPGKRPTAAELHQKGRHYLETGQWPAEKEKPRLVYMNTALVSALATAGVAVAAFAGVAFYQLEPASPAEVPTASSHAQTDPLKTGDKGPAIGMQNQTSRQEKASDTSAKERPKQASAPGRQLVKKPAAAPQKSSREPAAQRQLPAAKERVAEKPLFAEDARQEPVVGTKAAPVETKPTTKTAQTRAATTETKAASPRSSSSAKVERPSTSNTSLPKTKKPLFDTKPKAKPGLKKNPHQKRVKKLQRRFS